MPVIDYTFDYNNAIFYMVLDSRSLSVLYALEKDFYANDHRLYDLKLDVL